MLDADCGRRLALLPQAPSAVLGLSYVPEERTKARAYDLSLGGYGPMVPYHTSELVNDTRAYSRAPSLAALPACTPRLVLTVLLRKIPTLVCA